MTRVVVAVDDVNDHSPIFTERLYRVRIPATITTTPTATGGGGGGGGGKEVYRDIYRVFAHDKDDGVNADIDYSIKSGRGHGRFVLRVVFTLHRLRINECGNFTLYSETR